VSLVSHQLQFRKKENTYRCATHMWQSNSFLSNMIESDFVFW
jgi:hypothetical protein